MKHVLPAIMLIAMLCSGCGDYRNHETKEYRETKAELIECLEEMEKLSCDIITRWGVRAEERAKNTEAVRTFFIGFGRANELIRDKFKLYEKAVETMPCPQNCPHRTTDQTLFQFLLQMDMASARYTLFLASTDRQKGDGVVTGKDRALIVKYDECLRKALPILKSDK